MTRLIIAFVGGSMLMTGCGGAGTEQAQGTAPAGAGGSQATVSEPAAASTSAGPAPSVGAAPAAPAPEFREIVLPEGAGLALRLASTVASDTSQVEDAVRATLREAVVIDGTTVLPAGTEVDGVVTAVERSGRVRGLARVAFRFTTVRSDGTSYAIRTDAIERVAETTRGEDAKKIGIGAGVGAAVGAVLGGGDGAAKGAAIGAGAGTGAVLATRGEEVRLGAGAAVGARLAAPVAIQVRVRN